MFFIRSLFLSPGIYLLSAGLFLLLIQDVRRKSWPDDEPLDNNNTQAGKKNTLITSLCSNLFQALQFTPALCFQVLQNAMSLIPDWLLCCRTVSAPALLVRHFFFLTRDVKEKKKGKLLRLSLCQPPFQPM